jgi:DMSO/TMAO reductase YedYZ molybdopterin-dependent catalytic subunit
MLLHKAPADYDGLRLLCLLRAPRFAMLGLPQRFLHEHLQLSRRFLLKLGALGGAAAALRSATRRPALARAEQNSPELDEALAQLEPYFTPPAKFADVSRGKPVPHTLSEAQRAEAGLTPETWKLEIVGDPEHPPKLRQTFTRAAGTAISFASLLQMAERHAVRFAKVMTCLNIGCPLGMGIWEGVPLRELVWRAQPREDLRRLFYYGFHNNDPAQMFRSSLPIGRVLEDPDDLPPVIVCYKLNGQWLSPERGGPVRMVVPEAYGFKSIKWLSHVVLTNLAHANDTYAEGNNDIDSPLKSFAATLLVPKQPKPGQPFAVTGYAQAGIAGVAKVQYLVLPADAEPPRDDPYFSTAPWRDAVLLKPPADWGGELPQGKVPRGTLNFDEQGNPRHWPMKLAKVHWAALIEGLPPGEHFLRTRTIDMRGHAQPMPRPFRKSGHAAIEQVAINVK